MTTADTRQPTQHGSAEAPSSRETPAPLRGERPDYAPSPSIRTQLRARPGELIVYSGRSLLVTDVRGQIYGESCQGFFFENTRLLSRMELRASGQPLVSSGVSSVDAAGFLGYFYVNQASGVPEGSVYLRDARTIGEGMRVELEAANYSARQPAGFELALLLGADFADMTEAQNERRVQTGTVETTWDGQAHTLTFRYRHPQLDRAVVVRVASSDVAPRYERDALRFPLALRARQHARICLLVEPVFDGVRHPAPDRLFDDTATVVGRVRRALVEETPRLLTANGTVARAWDTATSDLASLALGVPNGPATPMAGLPLYQQYFGRDSLTIAWQALLALPTMMRDTLRSNAAWQATTIDDWRDAEPGKLIHQAGNGPLATLGLNPYSRYYGDYATPPDFLITLGQYLSWTNDLATVRALLPTARKAIEWLDRYGDLDGDGFIEYVTRSREGTKNQGWKDSDDAIVDEHARVVANPLAVCELQAYWYAGLRQVALAFFASGDRAYALELLRKAHALKARFDRAFWMEDERFYALALGPEKQQVRSIASNAGHLLAAGIVPAHKGPSVARRLLRDDMFSGWGIRTLSSAHLAYNPFSYHLGSVWPVENATIAFGLARYGCWEQFHQLAAAFFDTTAIFGECRLPEVLSGVARDRLHPHPGMYPHSNEPQGWSASAVVLMAQALLGIRPMAPLGLLVVDPHLPDWLPRLRLEGLRVAGSRLDLEFWRGRDGASRYRVTRRDGRVRVIRQPVPEGGAASLGHRAAAALGSLWRS